MSKGKIKIYLLKNGKFKKKNKIQSLASKDGVFYKRKGRGGGHYGPHVISARSNEKRLLFQGANIL